MVQECLKEIEEAKRVTEGTQVFPTVSYFKCKMSHKERNNWISIAALFMLRLLG